MFLYRKLYLSFTQVYHKFLRIRPQAWKTNSVNHCTFLWRSMSLLLSNVLITFQLLDTATVSTSDVSGLHAKLDRKKKVEAENLSKQEEFKVSFRDQVDKIEQNLATFSEQQHIFNLNLTESLGIRNHVGSQLLFNFVIESVMRFNNAVSWNFWISCEIHQCCLMKLLNQIISLQHDWILNFFWVELILHRSIVPPLKDVFRTTISSIHLLDDTMPDIIFVLPRKDEGSGEPCAVDRAS